MDHTHTKKRQNQPEKDEPNIIISPLIMDPLLSCENVFKEFLKEAESQYKRKTDMKSMRFSELLHT